MSRNSLLAIVFFFLLAPWCHAADAVYPLQVSQNGRYFVDQHDQPVFWLGNTQWQLCRDVSNDDVDTILKSTVGHGFTVVHIMLLGPGDGTKANLNGDSPWTSLDPLTPNEAFFKHVDDVVALTRQHNIVLAMMPYHQMWSKFMTEKNARNFARWLGTRYKDEPTILWSLCPEEKPKYIPVLKELAAGLREGDGGKHLITIHPDPSPCTSSFLHNEPWLDFNTIQVWRFLNLIQPMVVRDYNLKPTKPVVMAEGAYEAGTEYHFDVTPLWVRRQAYDSCLLGSFYSYGHNDFWRNLPSWREKLDTPGAIQMGILKQVFLSLPEWWNLVPDQSLLVSGGQEVGEILNLSARHQDGRWGLVYLSDPLTISVNLKQLSAATVNAEWIDPRTGKSMSAGQFSDRGVVEFKTPDGWEDAVLILK